MLGNGANGQEIIAQTRQALEAGMLPLKVFNDADLYALEKERIFARTWVFLAHESEIPKPGDYVLRYIADDSVIVVRDEAGKVRVLFNSCRHRGRQFCRAEKGQASYFTCPYHGWTYKNTGALVGVPHEEKVYGKRGVDKDRWGLLSAPQVESWKGWVFANLDHNAPPLDDYLGGMKWYLEFYTNRSEAGLEVVGVPQRWVMKANWKLGTENFIGDDYHVSITHLGAMQAGILGVPDPDFLLEGTPFEVGVGGGAFIKGLPHTMLGYPESMVESFKRNLTPAQARLVEEHFFLGNSACFPNLSFLNALASLKPGDMPVPYFTLRVWRPLGPDSTEIWSWFLVEKDAPESFKEASYRAYVLSFGSSGTLEQDDTENWMSITKAAGGHSTRQQYLNYEMGMNHLSPLSDWPGPGNAYPVGYTEFAQRAFWQTWLQYMDGEDRVRSSEFPPTEGAGGVRSLGGR